MNKIAVTAVIDELIEIQAHLPQEAFASSCQLIDERLTRYKEQKQQSPSSQITNLDHARADILRYLEAHLSQQKNSPLSKRRISETITALAKSRHEAASSDALHVNKEAIQAVIEELVYIRESLRKTNESATSKLLSDRIEHHLQRHQAYFDHPPTDVAEAQVEVLRRFSEHVSQRMKAPLRKKNITDELLKWETFARLGMPLPDQRHSPQNAAS